MTTRQVASLMSFEAATLAAASTLHLTDTVSDGKPPFRPDRAGIAEAILAATLPTGAFALTTGRRRIALGAIIVAIVGFCIGLSMTARGGATADIAYHAAMLPVLLLTLIAAAQESSRSPRSSGLRPTMPRSVGPGARRAAAGGHHIVTPGGSLPGRLRRHGRRQEEAEGEEAPS